MNQLFSIKDVANILGVSGKTLRRWEEKGILVPHRTPGNQRRYTQDQINNFRQQKRTHLQKTSSDFTQKNPSTGSGQAGQDFTKRLLNIQKTAVALGVSTKTLRRWEEKGILVPLRTRGNQRRYMRDQIDNFRQERGDLPEPQTESPEITPSQLFSEFPEQREVGTQYWTENAIKSILTFKKFAVYAVFAMVFVAGSGLIIAALNSANILNGGSKSISESTQASEVSTGGKAVLGVGAEIDNLIFGVKVQSEFAESAQFLDTIKVAGIATLSGGVITENQDVNAGTGRLTASNVLYGAVGGTGITVGPGQTPTITNTGVLSLTAGSGISVGTGSKPTVSNTGVLSLGGSTGALTLAAGTGISVSGLTITNSDTGSSQNIFKTIKSDSTSIAASSNTDTLTFASGTGITLTPDTTNKKITIAGSATGADFQENNGALSPSNITDDLLLGGISTSSAKFAVLNMAGGTPTASVSSGTQALTLSGDGTIQSVRNNTLTIGGDTTGNIVLSPNNGSNGLVTANSNFNLATGNAYQINGTSVLSANTLGSGVTTSSLTTVGTIATGVWQGTSVKAGYGGTGLTAYTAGDLLYYSSGTALSSLAIGAANQVLTVSGGIPSWADAGTQAFGLWQQISGTIQPKIQTQDLLLGGTTSASAKFAVLNMTGSLTPTASIS